MKKITRKIFISFLVLTGLVILYLSAVMILPLISVNENKDQPEEVPIYILTNGMHTDIVCPVRNDIIDWTSVVSFENTVSKRTDFQYVSFGWGDKGFYLDTPTWADLKFSTAFKAAFWLGDSAMHVTFYPNLEESEDCKKNMD